RSEMARRSGAGRAVSARPSIPGPARASRCGGARPAAGGGVDGLNAPRQATLPPGPTALPRAGHPTAPGGARELVGGPRMQRDGHHGALRLDAVVDAGPALAEIRGAVERAVLAAGGRAEAGIEHARVVGRHADVASVGERREATDLHVLPARAAILASE